MLHLLKRAYGISPNGRTIIAAHDHAESIAANDPRRAAARERALRELENLYVAFEAVEERDAVAAKNAEANRAELRRVATEDRHKAFASYDGRNRAKVLRWWRANMPPLALLERPIGSIGSGSPANDETDARTVETFITGLRQHAVLVAAESDWNFISKKFTLPKTLSWRAGGKVASVYHVGEHVSFMTLLGDRVTVLSPNDARYSDPRGRVVLSDDWITPPKSALPKGEPDLVKLPPQLWSIVSASSGTPESAQLLEGMIFD